MEAHLPLDRCPYCKTAKPQLGLIWETQTNSSDNNNARAWGGYVCSVCGGVCFKSKTSIGLTRILPSIQTLDDSIPAKAKIYLQNAIDTIHSPTASVMVAASSVDAMLKFIGLTEGSLYTRIEKAVEDHILTKEMAVWAHQVRLDANDQRHADENAEMPTIEHAERLIRFVTALAEFLFVLPSQVNKGIQESAPPNKK